MENMEHTFFVGRHLEDENDLTEGFDTRLKPLSEQSPEMVKTIVNEIIKNTLGKHLDKILIVSSDRKRAVETSQIIKKEIVSLDANIKSRIITDPRFAELHHGEPILPEGYVKEKRIEYLKDAWSAFWQETFDEEGNYRNYNYQFGDPIITDGEAKYPQLVGKFSEFGESYKDMCLRYYEGILEFLENMRRIEEAKLNLVLISHSAAVAIINKMLEVARDGKIFEDTFKTGDLMKICWQYYQKELERGEVDLNIPGQFKIISLGDINVVAVINILAKEVEFLKNN